VINHDECSRRVATIGYPAHREDLMSPSPTLSSRSLSPP
jgi:hypothetical protein